MPSEYSIIYNLKEDKYYLYIDDESVGSVDDRKMAVEIFEKIATQNPTVFAYVNLMANSMKDEGEQKSCWEVCPYFEVKEQREGEK